MEKLEGAQLDWEGTTDWGGTAGWVWRRSGMAQLDLMGWLEEGIAGSGGHSWIGRARLEGAQLDWDGKAARGHSWIGGHNWRGSAREENIGMEVITGWG